MMLPRLTGPPFKCVRRWIDVDPTVRRSGGRVVPRYEIEHAKWVWHPDAADEERCIAHFHASFSLPCSTDITIHFTADQYGYLMCDGYLLTRGPESCDVNHWAFSTLDLTLPGGEHRFDAYVWWAGDHAPTARMTRRPGFLLKAEVPDILQLDTKEQTAWRCRRLRGVSFPERINGGFRRSLEDAIEIDFREGKGHPAEDDWTVPEVIAPGLIRDGVRQRLPAQGPWELTPARLPEQIHQKVSFADVRGVWDAASNPGQATTVPINAEKDERVGLWRLLIQDERSVDLCANSSVSVLLDFEDYVCGFPCLELSGGRDALIEIAWAESCFDNEAWPDKGNRNRTSGRSIVGVWDRFILDGEHRTVSTHWWRSGRYVLLSIVTGSTPLCLHRLNAIETHYPIPRDERASVGSEEMRSLIRMCQRGMDACSHDIYLDCPYYEQRMFLGDSRLEALVHYVLDDDTRLARRSIELFDWSRHVGSGLPAARYPCRQATLISTFAPIWVLMLHDFMMWRNDPSFLRDRLAGMRVALHELHGFVGADELLHDLPGRTYIDAAYEQGECPGDRTEGGSAATNAIVLLAINAAAHIEKCFGDADHARWLHAWALRLRSAIRERFRVPFSGIIADDAEHRNFSQATLALAVLSGVAVEKELAPNVELMLDRPKERLEAFPYFQHYVFEAARIAGRGDWWYVGLGPWRRALANGMRTPPEGPCERTRSDCHAWNSHPRFHLAATAAGVRPLSPGFKRVEIRPHLGPISQLEITVPHPRGEIAVSLLDSNGSRSARVSLPQAVTGVLRWGSILAELVEGENELSY